MTVHVFRGPTIRHGDLLRLAPGTGDTVVIVDGVFHQSASVRHKEILAVLAAGARVIGCSSMGALRAAELDRYGMVGIGRVYAMYRDGITDADADADVAVVHTEGTHARALTVPMVDVLAQTQDAVTAGVNTAAERDRIIAAMAAGHYTERTWQLPGLPIKTAEAMTRFRRRLAEHPSRGVKHADAVAALRYAARPLAAAAPDEPGWTDRPWRSEYVRDWAARFGGRTVEGCHVPFLAEVQHQQLFDPRFPARRRGYVLAWVTGLPPCHDLDERQLTERVLAAAADRGMAYADFSARQLRHWLTETELRQLEPDEALLRILVRGVRTDAATTGWPDSPERATALLDPLLDSAAAVAHAYRTNDRAFERGVSIHRLNGDMVERLLRRLWRMETADSAQLTAQARDRGLGDVAAATTICRQFILAAMGEKLWEHLAALRSPRCATSRQRGFGWRRSLPQPPERSEGKKYCGRRGSARCGGESASAPPGATWGAGVKPPSTR